MKSRPSFLRRFLDRFFHRRPALTPVPPRRPAPARVRPGIEPLEGRVAPATFTATSISYNDVDGDLVTVTFSKAIFDPAKTPVENHLDNVFKFVDDQNAASLFASTGPQQLQLIDLSQVTSKIVNNVPVNPANGTDIIVGVTQHGAGDGLTNIGAIKASQLALGNVSVPGDLGQIDAGTPKSVVGVASLHVTTLGKMGLTTQLTGTSVADGRESKITGKLTSLIVDGDLYSYLHVVDGNDIINNNIVTTAPARIGSAVINGSLHGDPTVPAAGDTVRASDFTGLIESAGTIHAISVLGTSATDPAGLIGGGGTNSGSIIAGKGIASVTVSAALNGGGGSGSGSIVAKAGGIASLNIGGGLKGSTGTNSGDVQVTGAVTTLTVAGGLTGGAGGNSGELQILGAVTTATFDGGFTGGTGALSGSFKVTGDVSMVRVAGLLTGGSGVNSGSVQILGNATVAKFPNGIVGGAGSGSGNVQVTGNLTKLVLTGGLTGGGGLNSGSVQIGGGLTVGTITGNLTGGDGDSSAVLSTGGAMGTVVVTGDLGSAGTGPHAGGISAGGTLTSFTLNGKIVGGSTALTGFIEALQDIGTLSVTGDVTGGLGQDSATIVSGGNVASLIIGGKLVGGQGVNSGAILTGTDFTNPGTMALVKVKGGVSGGDGFDSGSIIAGGTLGNVVLGNNAAPTQLLGGGGDFSGIVSAANGIASVVVKGSVQGGGGKNSGSIQSTGRLASVNIAGSLTGGTGDSSGTIVGHDQINNGPPDVAGDLGIIVIGGDIAGGAGAQSGGLQADGNLASLTAVALKGGAGAGSGSIATGLGIKHRGNAELITLSGAITSTAGSVNPSLMIAGHLTSLTVGAGVSHGDLHVGDNLVTATITGDFADSHLTARGQIGLVGQDVAIGSLLVTGNVTNSQILAGLDLDGTPSNADASIGFVKVKGNWTASDLVAGAMDVSQNGFGNADDLKISGGIDSAVKISQIASVIVKGTVEGTAGAGDHFGFEAQQILAFRVGTTNLALLPQTGGQTFELGTNSDVTVREIPV